MLSIKLCLSSCSREHLKFLLGPRPHVAGYFRKRRFFSPCFKTICIKKLHPHVTFSNCMCGRASPQQSPYSPVNTNTMSLRFQKSSAWRVHLKISVFGARKRRLRVDDSRVTRKKSSFLKIPGYVRTCPDPFHRVGLDVMSMFK